MGVDRDPGGYICSGRSGRFVLRSILLSGLVVRVLFLVLFLVLLSFSDEIVWETFWGNGNRVIPLFMRMVFGFE